MFYQARHKNSKVANKYKNKKKKSIQYTSLLIHISYIAHPCGTPNKISIYIIQFDNKHYYYYIMLVFHHITNRYPHCCAMLILCQNCSFISILLTIVLFHLFCVCHSDSPYIFLGCLYSLC